MGDNTGLRSLEQQEKGGALNRCISNNTCAKGKDLTILPLVFPYSITMAIVGGYGTLIVSDGIDGSNI